DALEVAEQVHAEVPARRQRRAARLLRVVGRAVALGEAIKPGLDQHRLQAVVEGVPRRARQLRPADHQVRLSLTLPAQRHDRSPRRYACNESARLELVNGLLLIPWGYP